MEPLSAPCIILFRTALLHCVMKGTHGDITHFYLKFRRIQDHFNDQNASIVKEQLPHISTSFVPAGKAPTKTKTYSGLMAGANDWKLLVDLPDSNYVFPPEVLATLQ